MKRGQTAIILILVLIVAAIAAFVLFKQLSPSGAAQIQPVIFPGEAQTIKPQCCRSGYAEYLPQAHVLVGKCNEAYKRALDMVLVGCAQELGATINTATCKSTNTLWENSCKVELCCTT